MAAWDPATPTHIQATGAESLQSSHPHRSARTGADINSKIVKSTGRQYIETGACWFPPAWEVL